MDIACVERGTIYGGSSLLLFLALFWSCLTCSAGIFHKLFSQSKCSGLASLSSPVLTLSNKSLLPSLVWSES